MTTLWYERAFLIQSSPTSPMDKLVLNSFSSLPAEEPDHVYSFHYRLELESTT